MNPNLPAESPSGPGAPKPPVKPLSLAQIRRAADAALQSTENAPETTGAAPMSARAQWLRSKLPTLGPRGPSAPASSKPPSARPQPKTKEAVPPPADLRAPSP